MVIMINTNLKLKKLSKTITLIFKNKKTVKKISINE